MDWILEDVEILLIFLRCDNSNIVSWDNVSIFRTFMYI